MLTLISRLRDRDETGASAVEYGLLVAGIAALVVVIVFALGGAVGSSMSDTCTTVGSHTSSGGADACKN